jgi:hypothetical protein
MQTFFVEIKCKLGKTYEVASELADRGDRLGDLLLDRRQLRHPRQVPCRRRLSISAIFVAQKVQSIPEIADTHTIITFKAF